MEMGATQDRALRTGIIPASLKTRGHGRKSGCDTIRRISQGLKVGPRKQDQNPRDAGSAPLRDTALKSLIDP